MMSEVLSFRDYKNKYKYIRTDELIAYELYLLLKKRDYHISIEAMERLLDLEEMQ